MPRLALAGILALLLFACSRPAVPVGRWEGAYESDDVMIATRLEIAADGSVRVSAPDLLDIGGATAEERSAMRLKLAADLAAAWADAVPRNMDFDGKVFRKPEGIAPQMLWNNRTRQMRIVVYIGTRPGIQIGVHQVSDFTNNPWTS